MSSERVDKEVKKLDIRNEGEEIPKDTQSDTDSLVPVQKDLDKEIEKLEEELKTTEFEEGVDEVEDMEEGVMYGL